MVSKEEIQERELDIQPGCPPPLKSLCLQVTGSLLPAHPPAWVMPRTCHCPLPMGTLLPCCPTCSVSARCTPHLALTPSSPDDTPRPSGSPTSTEMSGFPGSWGPEHSQPRLLCAGVEVTPEGRGEVWGGGWGGGGASQLTLSFLLPGASELQSQSDPAPASPALRVWVKSSGVSSSPPSLQAPGKS